MISAQRCYPEQHTTMTPIKQQNSNTVENKQDEMETKDNQTFLITTDDELINLVQNGGINEETQLTHQTLGHANITKIKNTNAIGITFGEKKFLCITDDLDLIELSNKKLFDKNTIIINKSGPATITQVNDDPVTMHIKFAEKEFLHTIGRPSKLYLKTNLNGEIYFRTYSTDIPNKIPQLYKLNDGSYSKLQIIQNLRYRGPSVSYENLMSSYKDGDKIIVVLFENTDQFDAKIDEIAEDELPLFTIKTFNVDEQIFIRLPNRALIIKKLPRSNDDYEQIKLYPRPNSDNLYSSQKNGKAEYSYDEKADKLTKFMFTPKDIDEKLYPHNRMNSGTPEFPTIQDHHEAVINNLMDLINKLEINDNDFTALTGLTKEEFIRLLALHDIGKGINHENQHILTKNIINLHKQDLGEQWTKIFTTIISQDPLGEYITNSATLKNAAKLLNDSYTKLLGRLERNITKEQYFKLMEIFYFCDMGSYPGLRREYFDDNDLTKPKSHLTDKLTLLQNVFLGLGTQPDNVRTYNDPSIMLQNLNQYLEKNTTSEEKNDINAVITASHWNEYAQIPGYQEKLIQIFTQYNVIPYILNNEESMKLNKNNNITRISSLNEINCPPIAFIGSDQNTELTTKTCRQYIALPPAQKHTPVYSRLPVSNLEEKQAIIKEKQAKIIATKQFISVISDKNDKIVKEFCDTGLIVSVQNLDFILAIHNKGNEALHSKGDRNKPWNLLSTSVIGQSSFVELYGNGAFAIMDNNLMDINFAWDTTPGSVNNAHSQATETKESKNGKIRVVTGHSNNAPRRDRIYNKNGEHRTTAETIAAITSENLKNVFETGNTNSYSEQKIGLTPGAIQAIGIQPEVTDKIKEAIKQYDGSSESKIKLQKAIITDQNVQKTILQTKKSMREAGANLPIYGYIARKIDGKLLEFFMPLDNELLQLNEETK